jgi:hypothetical protein
MNVLPQYCCDGELVCRDELLSPAMDDALDAFIRECLDASFLTSGVLADSVESPIQYDHAFSHQCAVDG